MAAAVCSALGQTVREIEVIVIDDATEDHTSEILERLQRYDDRLRVIRLHQNLGISGGLQRNEGLKVARGQYIAYLDDDDVMTPWSVEHRMRVLEHHPELDFVWGRTLFVRNNMPEWPNTVWERLVPRPRFDVHWSRGTIIPDDFMHRAGVVGGESGTWWTPGRGEDQRLLQDLISKGKQGVPLDSMVAIYGRGQSFSGVHNKDRMSVIRQKRWERWAFEDVHVEDFQQQYQQRPAPAPARMPLRVSERLRLRNAETLREAQADLPPRMLRTQEAGDAPVSPVRGRDEESDPGETTEMEV